MYDYIIVGAGPSGLTLAHLLSKNNKILIIDRENSPGGCHRVIRQNGLFTEHGPRVYSSAYVNFNKILKDLGTDMSKEFVNYHTVSDIGGIGITNFSLTEMLKIIGSFMIFLVFPSYGITTSMKEFTKNFSKVSQDYIDSLCRLSDGAGADRYTLNQFLNIFNDQGLHTLYQPKEPMDIGIMKKWYEYLINTGNVTFITDKVVSLEYESNKIVSVNNKYSAKRFVHDFANKSNYDKYISITFHFSSKLDLPKVYGYPAGSLGLAFIVLSDYMNMVDIGTTNTVISTVITKIEGITGMTQTELIAEALKQLRTIYPELPDPYKSLISPDVDTAFVLTNSTGYIHFTGTVENLYNLGTHNGYSKYHFTSMESAVSNAFQLAKVLGESSYKIECGLTLRDIFWYMIIIIILVLVYYKDIRLK
jgi:hypothetical protein